MNKKIFTLFAGALLLLGSAFTVSAQTSSPYTPKYADPANPVSVAFRDSLSIDTAKKFLSKEQHYYVISVTGIANADLSNVTATAISTYLGANSNSQLALFIDGDKDSKDAYLRIDTIGSLDYSPKYDFTYKGSTKFGAIRRASWCVKNQAGAVDGSNRIWDFTNTEFGKQLEAPIFDPEDTELANNWSAIANGQAYKKKINMFEDDLIVSGWHFSQTYDQQDLQTSMPLYSYVSKDSVVVLVVDSLYEQPTGTKVGGFPVTVKKVSVNDLIADAYGHVKTGTSKDVQNVLLFTLKKINPFVLNANDYNAVNDAITFDQDANMAHGTDGWNPFTKGDNKAGNNGMGWLKAEEVSDSLYHYGYMYMKNDAGKYLYVDTAFWNAGNTNYLSFAFSNQKRDSIDKSFPWGDSFTLSIPGSTGKKPDSVAYMTKLNCDVALPTDIYTGAPVTDAMIQQDSTVHRVVDSILAVGGSNSATWNAGVWTITFADVPGPQPATWPATAGVWPTAAPISAITAPGTCRDFDYRDALAKYQADSINYLFAFYKDSIMENQSKFRVVYDPWEDNAKINVYQTRFAYPNLENQATTGIEWPYWWENSFDLTGKYVDATNGAIYATPEQRIKLTNVGYPRDGLTQYATSVFPGSGNSENDGAGHRYSDKDGGNLLWHGAPAGSWDDYHSFMEFFEKSSPNNMDKVMISTADTAAIYNEYTGYVSGTPSLSGLAHEYSYSVTKKGEPKYQDSLFYVTIQDLDNGLNRIATIAQNGPAKLRQIKLGYGIKCEEEQPEELAAIGNDLYLIRNSLGQYLCVPIWSATDSIYWVNPEHGEDPSRMPCYQWALETLPKGKGQFKLTNREFERVSIPYASVSKEGSVFNLSGEYAPKFNNRKVYGAVSDPLTFGMKFSGAKDPAYDVYQDGNDYIGWAEKQIPLSKNISFFPLDEDVKGDQLLGYTYIDKDATIADVYALKYKHFMTSGGKQKYVGWNGYDNKEDTTLYVNYESDYDKLFFDLNEMPFEDIADKITGNDEHIAITKETKDFASIYDKYAKGTNNYTNSDSLVMEKFGYMPTMTVKGELQYDYNSIKGLKPLARQAYRFLLKDYYKFSPTIGGDFWTVGENDNYILADKVYATKKYNPETGNVAGVFGIPYFYLRNTFFNYQESDGEKEIHDYFALVQRLDTVNYKDNSGTNSKWEDIYEYLRYRFGGLAADMVKGQVIKSHELGAFVAVVEDYTATLKMAVRGDAAIRVSTFRLDKDNDPIYRRFHVNEPSGKFYPEKGDEPDTLEFHRLNRGDLPLALYENSGEYLSFYDGTDKSLHGVDGGRIYNYANASKTELLKDSLGNVISFLGVNNLDQYPGIQGMTRTGKESETKYGTTNYAIFVDTAYINRGTGWIKPQYMLAVDPYSPTECGECIVSGSGTATTTETNPHYILARYLYNTAMYAKQVPNKVLDVNYDWRDQNPGNFNLVNRIDTKENAYNSIVKAKDGKNYCDQNWERLAFSWAIHKGDSLYVLKGAEPAYGKNYVGDPERLYADLLADYGGKGGKYIDFDKLIKLNTVEGGDYTDTYYPGLRSMKGEKRTYHTYKSMAQVKEEGRHVGLQAIIALDDNTHKDWVFSMRYIERNSDDFVIESETTNRDTESGAVIRPGYGGWVKYQNGIPVITRSDEKELMGEGLIMNVQRVQIGGKNVDPVSNEAVSTNVAVVAGTGNVTIMNASGKKVVISNVLGQTVVNTVLSSDNASIAVPAGVVVVAVEGEAAVKAVVK